MERWQRRAIETVGGLLVLAFIASVAYHYVLVVFEGRSPTYFQSTQVVVETFTGTGYGSDSPWETPLGNVFVIVLDLSTFLVLFIVLPYVFQPILEESLSPEPSRTTSLSDHVIVACSVTSHTERLIEEFETRGVEYVVVVEDEQTVLDLEETGKSAIYGNPTAGEALSRAGVGVASSVVVDVEDEDAASSVLAVREQTDDVRVVALCRTPSLEEPLQYAGADIVVTPRHLLAQRIADQILSERDSRFSNVVSLGEEFALVEATVFEDSPLQGTTVGERSLSGNEEVDIVGLWADGEFVPSPSPETEIDERTTLILAGPEAELKDLEAQTRSVQSPDETVVIAGYGRVGGMVRDRLERAGIDCTVIDRVEKEGVDVVGDATDETTLREASVKTAAAYVVALGDDNEALLSVLLARRLASDVDIVARLDSSEAESKVRRAGANYVLCLPDITGRLVALNVLREKILSYDSQIEVVSFGAESLPGETLADIPIRESGCLLVAVERDGEFHTGVSSQFALKPGDDVLVAGDDEAINAFRSVLD